MSTQHAFQAEPHDHQLCIDDAIEVATRLCAERGMRFTKIRERVLTLIWAGHQPIGAYAILEALQAESPRAAPPTVYRALDFLIEIGLVHRIESMNAYVGCTHPDDRHTGQFLICEGCGAAAELDDPAIDDAIKRSAGALGFLAQRQMIEISGLCPDCRPSDTA